MPGPYWQPELAAELLQLGKRLKFRLIARAVRLLLEAVKAATGIDRDALRHTGVAAVAVFGEGIEAIPPCSSLDTFARALPTGARGWRNRRQQRRRSYS